MSYPQIFKLNYSKKFLRFFYTCCFITLTIVWLLAEVYFAIILSIMLGVYTYFISEKIRNTKNIIVLNKNSVLINDKKLVAFNVVFSNNVWTSIKYKHKDSNNMNLLIFSDSCLECSINHINKYLNFATKTL